MEARKGSGGVQPSNDASRALTASSPGLSRVHVLLNHSDDG
jgi:hypothetical protein